jgi:4-hydroxy-tetrahydrodipicolinate reductase
MIKIGILGARGRMGQALIQAVLENAGLDFFAGSERAGHPDCGKTIPGTSVLLTDTAQSVFEAVDIVIDFTPPGATIDHAKIAAATNTKLVVGTTGLTDADFAALDVAAQKIAIIQAGNYSLGVNVLTALAEQAAKRLGADWDIEIVEMHHRHKIDAPSGTALMLGEAAATGRGTTLSDVRSPVRDGVTGERKEGSIGFAALRGGSVIGEHDIVFASEHERITLSHRAENRGLFAAGAVKAAAWLSDQSAGRYTMRDVLDL